MQGTQAVSEPSKPTRAAHQQVHAVINADLCPATALAAQGPGLPSTIRQESSPRALVPHRDSTSNDGDVLSNASSQASVVSDAIQDSIQDPEVAMTAHEPSAAELQWLRAMFPNGFDAPTAHMMLSHVNASASRASGSYAQPAAAVSANVMFSHVAADTPRVSVSSDVLNRVSSVKAVSMMINICVMIADSLKINTHVLINTHV